MADHQNEESFSQTSLERYNGLEIWQNHVTNEKVMTRSDREALQDAMATRRRFIGYILRLPSTRPANMAMSAARWEEAKTNMAGYFQRRL